MAKVMISMPEELLRALDAAARRRSGSRSEFIRQLLRAELEAQDLAGRRERGIDAIRSVPPGTSWARLLKSLVREERDR